MINIIEGYCKNTEDTIRYNLRKVNREKCHWLNKNSPIIPTNTNHDFYLYDDGKLIGGALGHIKYGWWHGDCLWIDEKYRNKGLGLKLMSHVESYANDNGLVGVYFETWDFQARPFYEKQGYVVFGELSDCPEGHTFYFMMKKVNVR